MWFQEFQRLNGRRAVFRLITRLLMSRGPMSRSELAEFLNVSNATMTHISAAMMEAGTLVEVGARPISSGRPPILMDVNRAGFSALGLFARDGRVAVVSTDITGVELAREEAADDPGDFPALARSAVERIVARTGPAGGKLVGIGAAISAGRDERETVEVVDAVRSLTDTIRIDGEAAAAATSELLFGRMEGAGSFGVVAVGSTVDAALVTGGVVPRRGEARGFGPAHVRVADGGPPCVCGFAGCLHLWGGVAAALDDFARRSGIRLSTAGELAAAAAAGNDLARAALRATGEHLGRGLTTLVDVADPTSLFIVGEGAALGRDYIDAAIALVGRERGFTGVLVRASGIDDFARARDAAALVIDDHVNSDEIAMFRHGVSARDLGNEKNESAAKAAAPRVQASSPQLSR